MHACMCVHMHGDVQACVCIHTCRKGVCACIHTGRDAHHRQEHLPNGSQLTGAPENQAPSPSHQPAGRSGWQHHPPGCIDPYATRQMSLHESFNSVSMSYLLKLSTMYTASSAVPFTSASWPVGTAASSTRGVYWSLRHIAKTATATRMQTRADCPKPYFFKTSAANESATVHISRV